jgi:hypothetical protein
MASNPARFPQAAVPRAYNMFWILFLFLMIVQIVSGIRREQKAGEWSWSKFVFALSFAALEFVLLFVPLTYVDQHSRYYNPLWITATVLAALNFIWFIIICRRWRLPDGRTSLEAYRDSHPK